VGAGLLPAHRKGHRQCLTAAQNTLTTSVTAGPATARLGMTARTLRASGKSGLVITMPESVPGSLAEALITLQASLPRITKDSTGQAGNRETKYANLAAITDAVLPRLAEVGLAWVCRPTMHEGQFVLAYGLIHAVADEELGGFYPLPNSNPQSIGGAITYARRYALCAVLGLAPAEDDDDANRASQEARDRQQQRTSQIADERAASPPPHTRPAERSRGRLPDDDWTTGGTR
jgi:hypothetical protein